MNTKEAIECLSASLRADRDYFYAWQSNIAMAFKDEWQRAVNSGGLPCKPEQIHDIANDAAKYFLGNLIHEKTDMNSSDKPNNLISLPTWFSDERCKDLIAWLDSLTIQEVEDLKKLQAENEILRDMRTDHLNDMMRIQDAERLVEKLQSQLNIALEALNKIAAWDDGEVVTSSFDSPGEAQIAREALSKIRVTND